MEDRMESFFLAETTKYLYLLFDPENFIHSDGSLARIIDTPNGECAIEAGGYIFNTEAHPIDPAMIYCCSAKRQKDLEMLQKFEDRISFISLLDLYDPYLFDLDKNITEASLDKEFKELEQKEERSYNGRQTSELELDDRRNVNQREGVEEAADFFEPTVISDEPNRVVEEDVKRPIEVFEDQEKKIYVSKEKTEAKASSFVEAATTPEPAVEFLIETKPGEISERDEINNQVCTYRTSLLKIHFRSTK